jgi:hypothetical protein
MRELPLRDDAVSFEGAVSLETREAGLRPWRLLHERLELHPNTLAQKAGMPAGVRVALVSDTSALEVSLTGAGEAPFDPASRFDLVVDDVLFATQAVGEGTLRFEGLPAGRKRLELYLNQKTPVLVTRVAVDAEAAAERCTEERPRWITYGSSITQCAAAHSPARTWPATAAREAGVHLTCLGFGGQCHLDPIMARTIQTLPADFINLKLGINVCGMGSMNARTFAQAAMGFIWTVRDAHPDIPILVVSPIYAPNRETAENAVGMTVEKMRADLADVVEKLRGRGDCNLHYLSGLSLLGPEDDPQRLPDKVHPDGEGYEMIGRRFAERAFGAEGPFALQGAKEGAEARGR